MQLMASAEPIPDLGQVILTLRGQRVILDADLAALYGVPVAVKEIGQAMNEVCDGYRPPLQ